MYVVSSGEWKLSNQRDYIEGIEIKYDLANRSLCESLEFAHVDASKYVPLCYHKYVSGAWRVACLY